MGFSATISAEDFNEKNTHQSHTHDGVPFIQKNHSNIFSNHMSQSSINGWSHPKVLTHSYNPRQQNPIPLIPNQNYYQLDWNLVTNQNQPVFNPPLAKTPPSKHHFTNVDSSYSNANIFEESMNNITTNNNIHMTYNTPISTNPMEIFNISHDFVENTMWKDRLIMDGHEPTLNQAMVASQPLDLAAINGIENTNEEMINHLEDQKKNEKMVKRNKSRKKVNFVKGKWSEAEDNKLIQQVNRYGTKNWGDNAKALEGRTGKQCRERWRNHLHPDIKKGAWTKEEERKLIEAHKVSGNKWTEIALQLPGRTENTIKNHWNATKRRLQLVKARESSGDDNAQDLDLENYIEQVAINNAATTETNGATSNTNEVDDGVVNSSMDHGTCAAEPLVDPATASVDGPMETTFPEIFEPLDDISIQKIMETLW